MSKKCFLIWFCRIETTFIMFYEFLCTFIYVSYMYNWIHTESYTHIVFVVDTIGTWTVQKTKVNNLEVHFLIMVICFGILNRMPRRNCPSLSLTGRWCTWWMHLWWCGFWWWALGLEGGPAWQISLSRLTHSGYLPSATNAHPKAPPPPTTPCIT